MYEIISTFVHHETIGYNIGPLYLCFASLILFYPNVITSVQLLSSNCYWLNNHFK
jgi:hypothetical protein